MSLRFPNKCLRHAAAFALSAVVLSAQAQAKVGTICLELPAGAGKVKAKISSGCLPTSPQHKGAFSIEVDAERAVIAVDGAFKPTREQRIGTADCMGSRTIEQDAEAAGPRRYSVVVNGEYRGILDASDTQFGMRAVKDCFAGNGQVQLRRPEAIASYRPASFKDWIGRSKDEPSNALYTNAYSTPAEAAAALLGNHPESMQGRPSAQISISKAKWQFGGFPKPPIPYFMAIQIEEHGYLDDSVSGKRTFAAVKQDPATGEWRIGRHWYQFMCARGERAGQWSGQPCP
uniref:hypothetical protein n=1 Tax=uncultured Erythrobacter sp. TaxID=263913 RepID=UPI0026288527|nr:hypothetical protein [uncultured Erythrobacter sp.]